MELPEVQDALRNMIGSKGWSDVVQPALKKMETNGHKQLVYGATDPKNSPEVIRGYLQAIKWMLSWPTKLDKVSEELQQALQEQNMEDEGGVGTIYSDKAL